MVSSIVKKLWCCGATTSDAPEGRVRVRVGRHGDLICMFDVEASHLNHPLFQDLLRSSEEEFGFSYDGALRIGCEVGAFRCLLRLLNASRLRSPSRVRAPKSGMVEANASCHPDDETNSPLLRDFTML